MHGWLLRGQTYRVERAEVGEETFTTGDREQNTSKSVIVASPDKEHDSSGRVERSEDGWMGNDVDDTSRSEEEQPDESDGCVEHGDLVRSPVLDEENER